MVYIQLPKLRFEFAGYKIDIDPDDNGKYKQDIEIKEETRIDTIYVMQGDKQIEKISHPVKLNKGDTLSIDYAINVELLG